MMQFKGFKPQAMQRIAGNLGYQGDMSGFNDYLNQNPDKMSKMNMYQNKAMEMAKGGMVKKPNYAVGGVTTLPTASKLPNPLDNPVIGKQSPDVDQGFYNSQEYRDFQNDPNNRVGSTDMYDSPYFGSMGSGSLGQAQDRAYEAYLATQSGTLDPRTGLMDAQGNIVGTTNTSPQTYSYTYDQAVNRQMQRDVKSPEEAAAIADAIARGPNTASSVGGVPQTGAYEGQSVSELIANRAIDPSLAYGATVQPVGTQITAEQMVDPRSGQVTGDISTPVTTATVAQADAVTPTDAATMTAATSADEVAKALAQTQAATGTVNPQAIVDAKTATATSVSELDAAQGTSILMENPVQRKIENGELISGVANAETASKFTEEVQAATASPSQKATVAGQLDTLMTNFEGGATPAWAAGAMRTATATMAARGLGASSMAGQAIVQAAMESALPIAMADAQTQASFETQNLSNRQQRAMLAAQQRATFMGQEFDQAFQSRVMNASKISDVANMNFTAEQQVALENSRNANTVNIANLSNRQAMVMAEAAALSNLDMANLSNRQQAAVMNAQAFMQMDLTNLSNQQQTELFKSQQQVQSLFTDQAATNAAAQFNASSQNQTDQFFANLTAQTSQFNTAQTNAQNQFNAGELNAQNRFAAEMMNQRDQFNAQNRLVIDQNNAQWRRQVATADTVAINRANEINAQNVLDISNTAYNDLWSYYSDSMEWAWNSAENERQRIVDLAKVKLTIDANADIAEYKADTASASAWGGLMATMFTSPIGGDTLLGKGLGAIFG
jgi:YD repeat-containing protein